jgi:uncharacterized protein YjbI with pentapeptide repeats
MANNHNYSLYEIARYSMASLLPQLAVVLLEFLGMLVVTQGNPSSQLIQLTFCISIVSVAWLEWRRNSLFNSSQDISINEKDFQIRLIKKSISKWNYWRHKNLYAELNLQHADLIEAKLSGAVLSRVDLRGADLRGAVLIGAKLIEAKLRGAVLIEAKLRGAVLSEADLRGADLRRADLSEADLSEAVLSEADLRGAVLRGADLRGADLRGADLSEADFEEAGVQHCRFGSGSGLAESTKTDLKQRGAIFDDALGDRSSVFVQR